MVLEIVKSVRALMLWFLLCVVCGQAGGIARGEEPDALTKSILGEWIKNTTGFSGYVLILDSDGTFKVKNGSGYGTWKWLSKADRRLELTHESGDSYVVIVAEDGTHANGQFVRGESQKIGKPVELLRKGAPSSFARALSATPTPAPPSAADFVKANRSNLVFVTTADGAGSGFIANTATGTFLVTNAHVAAGAKGATFKTLNGTQVQIGTPAVAVGHDIFRMALPPVEMALRIMSGVDENAAIGDEVVVLGNAEGAGVINTITGKIVGIGPNLVEVSAPFQPGNSGSPIIHLKTGKVIGVATYLTIREFDSATKERVKEPIVRRFGYRLDSVKIWQPVNWPLFYAQAAEMDSVEKLTNDLVAFLRDLGKEGHVTRGASANPAIKNRVDQWIDAKSKRLSPRDAAMADQSLLSFLKVTCQADITAAQQHLTYDYFQRALADQQRERSELSGVFANIIDELRK